MHYRRCLIDSSANPAIALTDAESWAKSGGGVPAQHCAALALVTLKRYVEAGTRLDKMAADRGVPDISFRTALYDQAGNAWLLAGDGARAVQSFSAALALSACSSGSSTGAAGSSGSAAASGTGTSTVAAAASTGKVAVVIKGLD
ncbi:MAG: hypothetical protein ACJ8H8_11970, partial [Geminicoccaceae bacterium]